MVFAKIPMVFSDVSVIKDTPWTKMEVIVLTLTNAMIPNLVSMELVLTAMEILFANVQTVLINFLQVRKILGKKIATASKNSLINFSVKL